LSITKFFPDYKEIGYTKKTTGVNGKLRIHIEPTFIDSISEAKHCFFLVKGCMVPFFIVNSEDDILDGIIKFESIKNPEKAREMVSKTIYLHEDQINQSNVEVDQLTFSIVEGFDLYDEEKNEKVGQILSVELFPEQEIATVLKADGNEALLPLNFHNVKGIDQEQKIIYVEIPEGLLDL
jgi:16S rRNA processing protein RimM